MARTTRTLTAGTLLLAASVLATTALAAPAAQQTATRETLKQYCTGDYLSFCGDLAPDTPELRACFAKNRAKLSPNCQGAIASYTKAQKRAEAR